MKDHRSIWETPGEERHANLNFWQDAVLATFCRVNIHSRAQDDFLGRIERHSFDEFDLLDIKVSPHTFERTPEYIVDDSCNDILINTIKSGYLKFYQFGREDIVGPGDMFLSDSASPFSYLSNDPIAVQTFRIPRRFLTSQIPNVEDVSARKIDAEGHWSKALAAYIGALQASGRDHLSLQPASQFAEQIVSLVRLAIGPSISDISHHQAKTLTRIRQAMRERLNEEGLSPREIANDVGISRSYLNLLLAKADTSFRRELDGMRIDLAMRMLGPYGRRLSIKEVALQCGFANGAHFSRKFRAARGMPPSEYRHFALAAEPEDA